MSISTTGPDRIVDSGTAAPHPEEMKATVHFAAGRWMVFDASARATPAGLVATALLVTALFVPLVVLARDRVRARVRASR